MFDPASLVVWLSVQCSGVVVAPGLVVYAGHCGEAVAVIDWQGASIAPLRCVVHPSSFAGFETDIAYCLVDEDVGNRTLAVGSPRGKLVGHGFGSPSGVGPMRSFEATFASYTDYGSFSVRVASDAVCPGDSGGPLFDSEGRLVGIASAALRGRTCNQVETKLRLAYYVPMSDAIVQWIAQETGVLLRG